MDDRSRNQLARPIPTRFVLLCHARTGSNLLLRALEYHPAVADRGEALIHEEATRIAVAAAEPHPYCPYRQGRDAAGFLDDEVFRCADPAVTVAGFKMFYEYARWEPEMRLAWTYLVEHRDIRIIRLDRHNLFDCLVSHRLAEATGAWLQEIGSATPVEPPLLWLDPGECHDYFDRIVTWRLWADRAFQAHPVLALEYERDLCGDFDGTVSRVFQFLDRKAHV